MSLRLRPRWPHQSRPDDFEVLEGEEAVGRIYLMYCPDGRPRWHWSLSELAMAGAENGSGESSNGMADSRDQAVATLKAAWDAVGKR